MSREFSARRLQPRPSRRRQLVLPMGVTLLSLPRGSTRRRRLRPLLILEICLLWGLGALRHLQPEALALWVLVQCSMPPHLQQATRPEASLQLVVGAAALLVLVRRSMPPRLRLVARPMVLRPPSGLRPQKERRAASATASQPPLHPRRQLQRQQLSLEALVGCSAQRSMLLRLPPTPSWTAVQRLRRQRRL